MRTQPHSRSAQRGIAVITAMLVVTIATVLAVEMAWQSSIDLRRTESLLAWDQARQFGLGAETYAASLLADKLSDQSGSPAVYSRTDDEQACGGFQFALDQEGVSGAMTGGVCDLQARFNLNNLVDPSGRKNESAAKQFRRLLEAISAIDEAVDIDPVTADTIVESAIDWIDPDTTADFNGAEDDTYTSEQPPYRAANFWFTSVSEIRAVRGVTPEIYAALLPYLAALPIAAGESTTINVNTASVAVLMSLGDDVRPENALEWVRQSKEEPFKDVTSFAKFVDESMYPSIGFSSRYFALQGLVAIGSSRLGMYSLLESDGQKVSPRLRQFDVVDTVPAKAQAVTDEEEQRVDGNE